MTDVGVDAETVPFEDVYRQHAPRVLLFCLAQTRNRADAEDLAADVFESAFAAYPAARPSPEVMLPWLLRIARNRVIDAQRRTRRRTAILQRFFTATNEADPEVSVADQVVTRNEARVAVACARRLSPRDRMIVGLRIMAGLSHGEIASVLGIPERTATVLSGRALRRLRRLYEETA